MNSHLYIWIVIVLLIAIVLGVVAYQTYLIYSAVQAGKVLMSESHAYEQHPDIVDNSGNASTVMKILVTGDSTAVGTGSRDPKHSTAGRLGSVYPNADISNVSQNGLKLDGLIEKLNALPSTNHYDLVLIQIGANDVVGLTPLSRVRTELDTILAWSATHSSHTLVLTAGDIGLSPVFTFPLNIIVEQRTLEVRSIYMQEIAKYPTITYIDLFKYRNDEPFNTNVPLYYAADHFHPSDAGYGLWFESIQKALPSTSLAK